MFLILAVLVVVVVAAGVAGASFVLGGADRSRRHSPVWVVAAALMAVLVLATGAGFLALGVGGGDEGDHDDQDAPVPHTARVAPREPSLTSPPQTPIGPGPTPLRKVPVQAARPGRAVPYLTVDGLGADTVVRVLAAGFKPFESGSVEQCVTALGHLATCTGRSEVQFGEDGGADFQYQMPTSSAPGGCHYGRATCTLRLTGAASGRRGEVQTVVDVAPRARITVEPRSGLHDRQPVVVAVAGFPPNSQAIAMLCALPGGYDARRCGTGPTTAAVDVAPDGTGRAELVVRTGPLGTDRAACGPRDDCAAQVVTEDGFVAAPAVTLHFSLGPGATYDVRRLAVGLSLAVALAVVAIVLVRRTDWTKPTEAATPEVDALDLQTNQSLDQLFGTDEELDERDPIPS